MTDVLTAAERDALTPEHVRARLVAGNDRFVAGAPLDRDVAAAVRTSGEGQAPMAAIVACIDSRVPPELVLDLGIGDAFVARVAGNVLSDDVLGSLEFATAAAGARLVVVLGHTDCGAVKGAADGVELGHLTGLLAKLGPAVIAAAEGTGADATEADRIRDAVERNVDDVVADTTQRSEVLRDLVDAGDLAVVGAVYDLATGVVHWR